MWHMLVQGKPFRGIWLGRRPAWRQGEKWWDVGFQDSLLSLLVQERIFHQTGDNLAGALRSGKLPTLLLPSHILDVRDH